MSISSQSTTQSFPYPANRVFGAFREAVGLCGMKLQSADETIGRISAKAGMSLFSWGEAVSIRVESREDGTTAVSMESALKFGANLAGAHRHTKNFESLISKASEILRSN